MPSSKARPVTRIVIVDDHPVVRAGLAALIEWEPDLKVVGQAAEYDDALAVIDRDEPDIILIDLSLHRASGLDLVKETTRRGLTSIVVSMHGSTTWATRALGAGARGYVHKSEAGWNIVKAIRKVQTGGIYVTESVSDALLERHVATGRSSGEVPVTALTDRELEVFSRIGKGMTTRQIADELRVSPKTIQTYRERLKQKLALESAAELAREATRWAEKESDRE
jgi:DNA-binding NarL/FixJ family response regulator